MPKNKFQDVIYTIIMASVMVYGMVAYNIVLNTGSMQNWVFLAVFHEWPIMTVIAILLELVFVGKLAMKVAFRLVNPREASQTSIMLAISAASVWLMCPCMSFFATLLFKDSHNAQFFAIWVQTTVMNFPMALLWQFFAAGPPYFRSAVPGERRQVLCDGDGVGSGLICLLTHKEWVLTLSWGSKRIDTKVCP